MMNLTVNRNDYTEYAEFMLQLKKALSYKGNLFAKQAVHSLDVSKMYKTLLPDYLYYRLFDDIGEPAEPLVSTYIINVEEIGGSGAYYIKHGLYRKDTNVVEFKVYPPIGLFIQSVFINNDELSKTTNENTYSFIMPDNDVLIKITYSQTMPITSIVYWGVSLIETVTNINNGNVLNVEIDKPFTIPYNNIGNSGYIWFATELPVILQSAEAFKSNKFLITGSFNEVSQVELPNYTLYVHKWPTEIDKINLYYE